MKKRTFLLAGTSFSCFLVIAGCSQGSNATGKVVDQSSNQPVQHATIIAEMKTDIQEDKKYERITAYTDSNGEFVLKGLSPRYSYRIRSQKENFFQTMGSTAGFQPAEKGKTKIISNPLVLFKKRALKGNVLDSFTGIAIEGVQITAISKNKLQYAPSFEKVAAISDAKGEFGFEALYPYTEYTIMPIKKGYTGGERKWILSGPENDFGAPLTLIPTPPAVGIYFLSNKAYSDSLHPSTASILKPVVLAVETAMSRFSSQFLYVSQKDMKDIPRYQKEPKSRFVIFDDNIDSYVIYPFSFLKRLPTKLEYDSFVDIYSPKQFLREQNIFLMQKACSAGELWMRNGYKFYWTNSPTKVQGMQVSSYHQVRMSFPIKQLTTSNYSVSGTPYTLSMLDINSFESGFYCLSKKDKPSMFHFEIK